MLSPAGRSLLRALRWNDSSIHVRIRTDGLHNILAPREPLPHRLVFRLMSIVSVATLFHNTLERAYMSQLETRTIWKTPHTALRYLGKALVQRLLIILQSFLQGFADRLLVSIGLHFVPMLMARIHRMTRIGNCSGAGLG